MLRYGWRIPFVVCAALGLVVGLVWYLIARNTPEEHSRVSPNELSKIKAGLPVSSSTEKPTLISWRRTFESKEVLAITLTYFSFDYFSSIFLTCFYIYLSEVRSLNPKTT